MTPWLSLAPPAGRLVGASRPWSVGGERLHSLVEGLSFGSTLRVVLLGGPGPRLLLFIRLSHGYAS